MFSQREEEKHILNYFQGQKGTFLDIGAWNGKTFSNTHEIALRGWNGICVEPSPSVISSLRDLYKDRPDIEIYNVCIGMKDGDVEFYDAGGDATSSTNEKETHSWTRDYGTKFTKMTVPMLTVPSLLKQSKYNKFDFLSIDVEDDELGFSILKQFDLMKLTMICIEASSIRKKVISYMSDRGFNLIYNSGAENIIVARRL